MRRAVLPLVVLCAVAAVANMGFRLGEARRPPTSYGDAAPSATGSSLTSVGTVRASSPSDGQALTNAATAFVAAFLDTGPDRGRQLADTTGYRLEKLLARTDLLKVPHGAPEGAPQVVAVADAATTMTQRLSDGSSIAFDLVADDSRSTGWVVTSVRPGER